MKIFDTFTFYNELDLLELRMEILGDVVDYFVINEANITFTGKEKPLYYFENRERFKKWEDKIIHHVTLDDGGSLEKYWDGVPYHRSMYEDNIKDEDWNFGGAVAFSTGYELVQKKKFTLDLQTQLQMGWTDLDKERDRDVVVLSIGLGFNWY